MRLAKDRRRGAVRAALFVVALLAVADRPAGAQGLELDPLKDGILLGVGLPWAGVSEYLVRTSSRDVLGTPDRGDVNAFDRAAMFDYSSGLNKTGDVLLVATVLAPATYGFFLDLPEMVTAGVIYVETIAFADAAKNTFKLLVPRYRPYMYSGGASDVDSRENDQSFLSGDATLAFAAATATVYLFSVYFPGSPWFVPLTAGAYGLATLTAALRVAAGMHFMTDVMAGAVLGSAIGYAVPYLHRTVKAAGDKLALDVLPGGFMLTYRY
jgi:membrane-associated phospholipid phosphatase